MEQYTPWNSDLWISVAHHKVHLTKRAFETHVLIQSDGGSNRLGDYTIDPRYQSKRSMDTSISTR